MADVVMMPARHKGESLERWRFRVRVWYLARGWTLGASELEQAVRSVLSSMPGGVQTKTGGAA
jgi:hypothetical protein